jgi:hypothetical protein
MIRKHFEKFSLVMGLSLIFSCLLTGYVFGAESSVEERIKSLEAAVKALELKATRAQDVIDIQNLQGRYEAVHSTDEGLSWMLFADRPDTTKEITNTKLIGFDNIKADYMRMLQQGDGASVAGATAGGTPSGNSPSGAALSGGASAGGFPASGASAGGIYAGGSMSAGKFTVHPVGTPVIAVADDGQTAKATFTSFGFEGDAWCYGKYANSYIKIDGKWYIWHMKWLRCFKTSFYKAWYDQTLEEIFEFAQKDENGLPKVRTDIDYSYLRAAGKKFETITTPKPYKTWTKEDEDGGWWKRETKEP